MIEFVIARVTKDPGLPGELAARFMVDVDITIRSESGLGADVARLTVSLPFDEDMTYGQIERDAINAALRRVDSIRNAQQRHSAPPNQPSNP